MVEIVKRGIRPEDRLFEARCSTCRTLFRFRASEGKYWSSCRNEEGFTCKCPVCGKDAYAQMDDQVVEK